MSEYSSFRPVAQFIYLAKVPFFAFLSTEKDVAILIGLWHSLVTSILNIYGFVDVASSFFWKIFHFSFFKIERDLST